MRIVINSKAAKIMNMLIRRQCTRQEIASETRDGLSNVDYALKSVLSPMGLIERRVIDVEEQQMIVWAWTGKTYDVAPWQGRLAQESL